jgi:zinc transport system permease protein
MVVPVATAQLLSGSFRGTVVLSMLIGLLVSTSGVVTSFYADTPSGGTIVLMAIAAFALVAGATAVAGSLTRGRRTALAGPDVLDQKGAAHGAG